MNVLYFTLLPLVNALNFSQILIIPLLVSMLATVWAVLSGQLKRVQLLWFDRLIYGLLVVILGCTATNLQDIDDKGLNHLMAFFVSVSFFYITVEQFTNRLSDVVLLRALWFGYMACTALAVAEFYMSNFKGVDLGSMIPRPAVEEYQANFLEIALFRARSTFEESGHFAAYMAICIPFLSYYHWYLQPSMMGRLLFIVLTISAMFAAFSVSAFIFLPSAIIIASLLHALRRRSIERSTGVVLLFVVLGLLVLKFSDDVFYNMYLRKFQGFSYTDRNEKFLTTINLMARATWSQVIFGFGPGSYSRLGVKPAISVYLNFFRDYGLLGVSMLVTIVLYAIIDASRLEGPFGRAILLGCVLSALYFLAIPNYFHPHYYLPYLFYKRSIIRSRALRAQCHPIITQYK